MQSEQNLSSKTQPRFAAAGLLAMAAALPAIANGAADDTYTWSAELVALDEPARTVTVQSRLVSNAAVDFDSFDSGDRVTLTWSGIDTAAGVRRIVDGAAPEEDRLTLPIEFVSAEHDNRYVRFKVQVPNDDIAELSALEPGEWITATSPRRGVRFEEAVADVRPYTDVAG
jgi:hypothetical protein